MQRAAIGVDVGGTTTKAGLVDHEGRVIARLEMQTDPSSAIKTIISIVEELLDRAEVEVAGIGIGAAGFIDHKTGVVTFSPNVTYGDNQVVAAVASRVDIPVLLENDANAAAWGEYRFGSAQGIKNMVLVSLGTGIGSGLIVDGQLLTGATGAGAEFGHTVVDPDGPACTCGLRGCIEQFASGTAIARMGREAAERDPSSSLVAFTGRIELIDAQHVAQAAREMDESARQVLRFAGQMLGLGLTNLVNLFDPDVVVLSGRVDESGEGFLGAARDELAKRTAQQRRRPVRLDVSRLGRDVGLTGAAALALDATR